MSLLADSTDRVVPGEGRRRKLAEQVAASTERLTSLGQLGKPTRGLERLTIAARTLGAERRLGPRMPFTSKVALQLGGMVYHATSIDIGRRGIMLARPNLLRDAHQVEGILSVAALGSFAVRLLALDTHSLSLVFKPSNGNPAHDGLMRLITQLEDRNAAAIVLSQSFANDISNAFIEALDRRLASLPELFATALTRVADTDPAQYTHPATALFERVLPPIIARYYRPEAHMAYAVATTRHCYVPVHQPHFSQSQRPMDVIFNHAFSRDRRIYEDRWTLRAAAFSPHPVVQAYPRDVPIGCGTMVRDVSAPIRIRNRHWGAAQIGYMLDLETPDPNEKRPRLREAEMILETRQAD